VKAQPIARVKYSRRIHIDPSRSIFTLDNDMDTLWIRTERHRRYRQREACLE
jgi:hypothetical protein